MTDQSTDTGATESTTDTQAKTFTQEEVNAIVAKQVGKLERKFESQLTQYSELGSPEELMGYKEQAEKLRHKKMMEKGEFEKILQEKVEHFNNELSRKDKVITEYRVNTPLINAAAKYKAINPEQVRDLVMPSVRLNEAGDVEVLDGEGKPRYKDDGKPFTVDDKVREFLDSNPHFQAPTPATTNTQSATGVATHTKFDVSNLDLTKPEDRKKYREMQGR